MGIGVGGRCVGVARGRALVGDFQAMKPAVLLQLYSTHACPAPPQPVHATACTLRLMWRGTAATAVGPALAACVHVRSGGRRGQAGPRGAEEQVMRALWLVMAQAVLPAFLLHVAYTCCMHESDDGTKVPLERNPPIL